MVTAQNRFLRVKLFLSLNIKSLINGLHFSRIIGRYNGPKILLNSFPKAGTNLIENTLLQTPGLRRKIGRMARLWNRQEVDKACLRIKSIKKGQFLSSHFIADDKIFKTMLENEIKGIMIIRDIRSKIISHFKYVSEIDLTHKTHSFFNNLQNDDEKISSIIDGVPNIVASLDEELNRYQGWLDNPNILVVRFEDLVGEMGGGSKLKQKESLNKIFNFLDIKISEKQFDQIQSKIFSRKVRTFRSGKTNNWKKYLKKSHIQKIKSKAGQWLITNGYEKNNEW